MNSPGRNANLFSHRHVTRSQETVSIESVYMTDKDGVPLARPVPRKELSMGLSKLISNLSWSSETSSAPEERVRCGSSDREYERSILSFLNRIPAERSSRLLKDRVRCTMNGGKDFIKLSTSGDEIRRRQEHIEGRIVQTPVLEADVVGGDGGDGVGIGHKAILRELCDLHVMMSSMECRRFDVNGWDVRAIFEWFKVFENFMRVYFWEMERGVGGGERRRGMKMQAVRQMERVEGMKRGMLGRKGRCGEMVGELRKRVDRMTMRIVRVLKAEAEGLRMRGGYERLVERLRKDVMGREMVVLLGQGAEGLEWICGVGDVGRYAAQGWVGRFVDRHRGFVVEFERAEGEYREFYGALGRVVDADLANIGRMT